MKDAERRLFRCMSGIDDELVLEAATLQSRPKRWGHLAALAACLVLVIAIPTYLNGSKGGPEATIGIPTMDNAHKGTAAGNSPAEKAEGSDTESVLGPFTYYTSEILTEESISGLTLGMTEAEITAILGQPGQTGNVAMTCSDGSVRFCWFYKTGSDPDRMNDTQLTLADTGEGWFLNEISLHGDSTLTLSTGIGMGSTDAEIEAAYPQAVRAQETSMENDQIRHHNRYTVEDGLTIQTTDGRCDAITLGSWLQMPPEDLQDTEPNPQPYDLTSNEITVYRYTGKLWETTTVIDKAAKGICTVLTISEPEDGESPESAADCWLDFGNGTAVLLSGGDFATVYTYDTAFDPDHPETMTLHLGGVFPDLDRYVAAALEDPTAGWD